MNDIDEWIGAAARNYVAKLRAKKPRTPRDPAAPKAKRGTPEMDQQEAVVDWLRKAGCIVSRNMNELQSRESDPLKRARFWGKLVKTGCTKGFPDITAITPDGRTVYIEMKAAKGVTTAAQDLLHADIRMRGGIVIIARDVWSAQDGLAKAGVILTASRLRRATPAEPLR